MRFFKYFHKNNFASPARNDPNFLKNPPLLSIHDWSLRKLYLISLPHTSKQLIERKDRDKNIQFVEQIQNMLIYNSLSLITCLFSHPI